MLTLAAYRGFDQEMAMRAQGMEVLYWQLLEKIFPLLLQSEGFSINTRDSPKCYKLTDKTVIGCSGFHGDCLTLTKIIEARLKMFKHSNNKAMTTGAIAAMLPTILYSRRFFPYYVYNIIGGLDEKERELCIALTQWAPTRETPSRLGAQQVPCCSLCLTTRLVSKICRMSTTCPCLWTKPMRLVKDVFISAAERDVCTGDALKICIVTKEGIREETVPLRKD
ncbi:hypothetical protein ACRRTK_019027 [Alexandromys fortis]